MLKTYPIPEGEPKSADYAVSVDGSPLDLYACRVSAIPFNCVWPGYQRPIDQTETASFVYFDMEPGQSAHLRVEVPGDFERAVARPLKTMGDSMRREGSAVILDIPGPGQYTLEIDGSHHALHIFVNPIEDYGVDIAAANVLYFGPGVHRPGKLTLEDDQIVFIDGGAVVHTSLEATGKRNIRVLGHGVFDNAEFERIDPRYKKSPTCFRFEHCANIEVRGVIFRDACAWTLSTWHCENIVIDNAKAIGMWRYNSDGFDFCNTRNVVLSNSFLRCFDDCVVLKGFPAYSDWNTENILVTGCVLWCDWGRALEVGAETCADAFRNILFTDCDVIRSTHMAMDIQNSGYAVVHGVRFANIRVEYSRDSMQPIYQQSKEMHYEPDPNPHMPYLMYAELHAYYHDRLVPDHPHGCNRDIVFSDIHVYLDEGLPAPPSVFKGMGEENTTKDILIDGLYINGERIDSLDEARVTVGDFASDVRIE